MQSPRHLVPALIPAKLAAGVKHGQHRLQRTLSRARMYVTRDAATVVSHSAATVLLEGHVDLVSVVREDRPEVQGKVGRIAGTKYVVSDPLKECV